MKKQMRHVNMQQGLVTKDFKLQGKYDKKARNQTARGFIWFYFSFIFL